MAKLVMRDQRVWLGAFDISGLINSLAIDHGAEARDAATLGAATRGHLGGLKTVSAQHEGYWDAANGLDEELFNRVGLQDAPLSYAAAGAAEGDTAYSFLALFAEYSPGAALGEVLGFSASAQAGGGDGLVRGTIMHNATRTTSANGTGRQLGAIAAGQKLFGILHVTGASGTAPTSDLTVESAPTNTFASPTTHMTFAQQSAAGFEWQAQDPGAVTDTWWRLVWALGGTTPSFDFTGILAIQ